MLWVFSQMLEEHTISEIQKKSFLSAMMSKKEAEKGVGGETQRFLILICEHFHFS